MLSYFQKVKFSAGFDAMFLGVGLVHKRENRKASKFWGVGKAKSTMRSTKTNGTIQLNLKSFRI